MELKNRIINILDKTTGQIIKEVDELNTKPPRETAGRYHYHRLKKQYIVNSRAAKRVGLDTTKYEQRLQGLI